MSETLISTNDLSVHFPLRGNLFGPKPVVRAVEGVTVHIEKGSFLDWWANRDPAKPHSARPVARGTHHPGRGNLLG